MADHIWTGVFPAVTTQFHKDLSLDLEASSRHWESLISSGVSGLVIAVPALMIYSSSIVLWSARWLMSLQLTSSNPDAVACSVLTDALCIGNRRGASRGVLLASR